MITKSEFDIFIRAYFELFRQHPLSIHISKEFRDEWHSEVVKILKKYPEYSEFFLNSEERGDEE